MIGLTQENKVRNRVVPGTGWGLPEVQMRNAPPSVRESLPALIIVVKQTNAQTLYQRPISYEILSDRFKPRH